MDLQIKVKLQNNVNLLNINIGLYDEIEGGRTTTYAAIPCIKIIFITYINRYKKHKLYKL